MDLKKLNETVLEKIGSCFMVKDNQIHEFKIAIFKGEKDDTKIQTDRDGEKAFFVGFDNPNEKKVWKPDYAQPVIVVIGIDDGNGKLSLSEYSKGGFDVPGAWFTIKGDFFLTMDSAKEYADKLCK